MRIGSVPSTQLLIVFECAARHSNFTRASEELFITQAAVSHSVRQLETLLGFDLFVRAKRRVTITQQGRDYLIDVRRILTELAETTHRIMALAGAPTINLAVVPTFSTYWMIPRLPGFLARYPDITINFRTRLAPFDIRAEGVDAAIHNGEPTWRGAVGEYLMTEEMLPVCSPAFRRDQGIEKPSDVKDVRLLHLATRFSAWNDWFTLAGVEVTGSLRHRGLAFDQFGILARAAAAGAGVALLPRFLVDAEKGGGDIEILFPDMPKLSHDYYLAYSGSAPMSAAVDTFRSWLVEEIGKWNNGATEASARQA